MTRPDIAYAVHIVSQFMASPYTAHFTTVLRILRYIKGTLLHCLCCPHSKPILILIDQVILLIVILLLVTASAWGPHLFHGRVRNGLSHPDLTQNLNIGHLLMLLPNYSGFIGYLKI